MNIKILAAAAALALCAGGAHAASFGDNLIANGDAEAGTTAGYVTTGDFMVLPYTFGNGYPVAGDPGVSEGGAYFFSGGGIDPLSTAAQSIDVSSFSSSIDGGATGFTLSALLGGYLSQDDNSVLSLTFADAADVALGSASVGPVSAADRGDATGLLARSTTGFVPVGTRFVDLLLTATRVQGSADDGYADNLSFVLSAPDAVSAAPEPSAWILILGGVGMLGAMMRTLQGRRRQDRVGGEGSA